MPPGRLSDELFRRLQKGGEVRTCPAGTGL